MQKRVISGILALALVLTLTLTLAQADVRVEVDGIDGGSASVTVPEDDSAAVARRAAVVLLMLSLSAAMVLAVSPKARADIIRWTMEQDGRRVEFRYHGDGPAQALPQYRIVALPEGYTETERIAYDSFGSVRYENAEGNAIELDYMYMQDGVSSGYTLADGDVKREVSISGMPGMLLISTEEGRLSYITWMDAAQNISFQIIADTDESVIIAMAESVSLCGPTN